MSDEDARTATDRSTTAKYRMDNNVLFKNGRRCISKKKEQETLIREIHDAPLAMHPGEQKTYDRLKELFYWP
ncbi:hypothetical protein EV180_007489, partial [Coemansia sp. RSA 518]